MRALEPRFPRVLTPGRESWVASGWVLAATVGLVCHCAWMAAPVVDDAAISLAYGLTFFSGEGLRLTPASQPVEGFSSPLWMLLIGLSHPLRAEPVAFMRSLGLVFGVLTLPVLALWGPAARGGRLRGEDAVGPLLVACNPTYVLWISSGMETGLEAFLLALSGALGLRELRTGGSALAGVALGLLCLTRPEGLLFTALAAGLWLVCRARERRAPGRQELRLGAGVVVLVGAWLAVRWGYFAELLPNTYYAKRFWDFDARQYLEGFARQQAPLCLLAAAGLSLGGSGGDEARRRAGLLALWLGGGVYFAWSAHGDWMPEWRFLAPLVPLLGGAVAVGLSGLRERWALSTSRPLRGALLLGALALVGGSGIAGRASLARAPEVKANPGLPYSFIAGLVRPLRPTLAALAQARPLVAMPDIGGLAMTLREAEIVDVAGLADYALAHHANNLPAQQDYLVSEGLPLLVDAHGPSGHVGGFQELMRDMRPLMGNVSLLSGVSATEDPRCPGGKAAVLAMDAAALAERLEQELRADRAQEALRRWRCALTYKAPDQLPERKTRLRLAELAMARGEALLQAGQARLALREYSLATLLDAGNAHRRRQTEALRSRLFPRER